MSCSKNSLFGLFVTLCICCASLISSCTSQDILLDQRYNPPVYFGTHVVRKGESLYSVALRYGRDYRELAAANNIDPPYVIVPGQKISLEQGGAPYSGASSQKSSPAVNVKKRNSGAVSSRNVTNTKKHKNLKAIEWRWPHVGPILAQYKPGASSDSASIINKGIDIKGVIGDPVYAAAAGEVVYAGSGLLGYGKLVIVNHNERYLSAYAHNRRILVQEGQMVKAGEKIAELGQTGTDTPKLHFEIRQDGHPVDPERFLPRKK